MRAVQVSEYVKVRRVHPYLHQEPKLTRTGPPRAHSLNRPYPITSSRQIPHRDPLGRYQFLRHPPDPRKIPAPTSPPLDRRLRIRRNNPRRPNLLIYPPIQGRRTSLRRNPRRIRDSYSRTGSIITPCPSGVEFRGCSRIIRHGAYVLRCSCAPRRCESR